MKLKHQKISQGVNVPDKTGRPADKLFEFWLVFTKDPRVTVRHIGFYAALLCIRQSLGNPNPMVINCHEVMLAANMVAQCTYHQYIKQLDAYGYLRYEPSFKKNEPSKIYFLTPNITVKEIDE